MDTPPHLIERLTQVTVGIRARIPESHASAKILGTERTGTGTLIDRDGLVLTVNYVVLGADRIDVTMLDGKTFPGRVVALEFTTGIALVQIEAAPCPAAAVRSSSDADVGQEVVIIASVGNADRRGNNGWITSLGPFDAYWEYTLDRAITTTAVNPGLGGAPVFDLLGNMIGIAALDLGEIGHFTLAIPAESFLDHREELARFGRRVTAPPRAWIGLYCFTFRDRVVIAGLLPGAPGERAGLQPGDVVVAVDDTRVATRGEFYRRLATYRSGERLTLQVFRNNQVTAVEVASGSIEDFFG